VKNSVGETALVREADTQSGLLAPYVRTSSRPHVQNLTSSRLCVRDQFPIFSKDPNLVYLDSAATAQKPRRVIDRLTRFYSDENANIHRGVYGLSAEATAMYDRARASVARFIGAALPGEVIFTRGTTEGINLVAQAWGRSTVKAGDEILVTEMEHHSNFVPWQMLAQATGAVLRMAPVTDAGELDMGAMARLVTPRTRIVAVTHLSNVLGTVNPIRQIADLAHASGALVLVDGAQSVAHGAVDVQALGCDFFAFSGHKVYGPTGIGVLYGRRELLDEMPPWQGGGGMIGAVSLEGTTWADAPMKFEAGTPPIAEAIGLAEAIAFMESVGTEAIMTHEAELLALATERLAAIPGVRLIGTAANRASVISFTLEGVHPHDLGTILDEGGVAIRAGHHCAQPLMRRFGVPATARASFSVYNTPEDVEALGRGVERARAMFA
jgi:cysteine desulfurase/selenocysteine lyase